MFIVHPSPFSFPCTFLRLSPPSRDGWTCLKAAVMRAKHFKLKIKQGCHNKVGPGREKQQQHIAAKVILCPKSLEVAVINQLFAEFPVSFLLRWLQRWLSAANKYWRMNRFTPQDKITFQRAKQWTRKCSISLLLCLCELTVTFDLCVSGRKTSETLVVN